MQLAVSENKSLYFKLYSATILKRLFKLEVLIVYPILYCSYNSSKKEYCVVGICKII
jgi:hypothetical protein